MADPEPGAVYKCSSCRTRTLRSGECPDCGGDDLEKVTLSITL